ncbi:MAG: hypothetical protein QM736_11715 [Vicinamibacterales bacterium]
MRVDDVERGVLPGGPVERGAHEDGKSPRVVPIVVAADAVEEIAVIQRGFVDEQRACTVTERRLEEAHLMVMSAQRDTSVFTKLPCLDSAVTRRHERHIPAETRDGLRQRPEHVGETACLRERQRFRTDHED